VGLVELPIHWHLWPCCSFPGQTGSTVCFAKTMSVRRLRVHYSSSTFTHKDLLACILRLDLLRHTCPGPCPANFTDLRSRVSLGMTREA
jgi:hypothetical protein